MLAHEHADILQAIESDDFEEVAALLTSHATHLVGYLEQQMRTDGTAAAAPGAGGEA